MNRSIMAALISFFGVSAIFAQTVSFSNPVSWITQRNDTVFIRAQLDTSLIKKKTVSVSLIHIINGKKKVVARKNLKVTDNIMELMFAKAGQDLIGGKDFLRLEWALPDSGEKGVIEPIGILNLQKVQKCDTIKAFHAQDNADVKSIAGMVSADRFTKLGTVQFATAWNKNFFFIVMNKTGDSSTIRFALDGKNGKNAFLSYPDRIISYTPSKDSLAATHYNRELKGDLLKYVVKTWQTELTRETIGDKVVISMPWADIGVIPFEERVVGMGAFVSLGDEKVVASIPQKAQLYIPGTWGDVILQK